MARKKKKSFSLLVWLLFALVSGGGVGGFINPSLPIIGPIVAKLMDRSGADPNLSGERLAGQILDGRPKAEAVFNRPANDAVTGTNVRAGQQHAQLASSRRPTDRIFIASFNIQVLGESKMSKSPVVEILAHVIRQFDVVAIQEVRAKSDDILPRLVAAVNADGSQYNFLIGPRLGRTVSKEQYAFVYDTRRIEHDPSATGTIQDPTDLLHREPYAARFRARTNPPEQGFTFFLVNAHTDPDEVPEEVAALADVFRVMQQARPDEDDVILLGDLNASESQLGPLAQIPGISWAIRGAMTNTRKNKMYDNLLFHSQATSEFTGRWGVYDLEGAYGLTRDQALQVSDHLPVWAEFGIWEASSRDRFANQFQEGRR